MKTSHILEMNTSLVLGAYHTASYLSHLASTIELLVERSGGHKVVIVAHSMGGNFMLFFQQWVTQRRGPTWVNDHVHALVKLAVPTLGVPKALTALLSGESRDTAELGILGALLDHHLPCRARRRLFRSWGSTGSMLPKGGTTLWGALNNNDPAPDFLPEETERAQAVKGMLYVEDRPLDVDEAIEFILQHAANETLASDGKLLKYRDWYSWGLRDEPWPDWQQAESSAHLLQNAPGGTSNMHADYGPRAGWTHGHGPSVMGKSNTWYNPLESRLPWAPNMSIYALYGVGKETERTYLYRRNPALVGVEEAKVCVGVGVGV